MFLSTGIEEVHVEPDHVPDHFASCSLSLAVAVGDGRMCGSLKNSFIH